MSEGAVLNCRTPATATGSLAHLYKCGREELRDFGRQAWPDRYAEASAEMSYAKFLEREAERALGSPQRIALCHWFHLTRVPPTEDFSEGLLPLGEAVDRVWDAIGGTLGPEDRGRLEDLKAHGPHGSLYNLRVEDRIHWGPHAMLVRETAFDPHALGHVDYLDLPEIVDDICGDYASRFGDDIRDTVRCGLRPCIVEFRAKPHSSPLGAALAYLVDNMTGSSASASAGYCFDARGRRIEADDIVAYEFNPAP